MSIRSVEVALRMNAYLSRDSGRVIYSAARKLEGKSIVRADPNIHKVDQSRAKSGELPAGRLIVNCKQFRNCVDKAIKPFDWLREAKRSIANTPG